MKLLLIIMVCFCMVFAQKGFTPEYFVKKHNLILPEINEKNIDISKHTHKSDSWFYFYKGNSDRVDSVYRFLNIERLPANKQYDIYHYKNDSVVISSISIAQNIMDTTNNLQITFSDNYKNKTYYDKMNKCYTFVKFTPWGKRKSEKNLCPGDKEPHGQEFTFTKRGDYIEATERYNGSIDSNTIRRYYFSSFDSLVADYMVKTDTPLVSLFFYTKTRKIQIEYTFDFNKYHDKVDNFDYYTYTSSDKLFRIYHFDSIYETVKAIKREYELINYTEYSYDSLGRKTSMITRVIPD
jgi:hypothetical protein